jgi:hypothetical protein
MSPRAARRRPSSKTSYLIYLLPVLFAMLRERAGSLNGSGILTCQDELACARSVDRRGETMKITYAYGLLEATTPKTGPHEETRMKMKKWNLLYLFLISYILYLSSALLSVYSCIL